MRITRHDIVKRPSFLSEVVDLVKNNHYNNSQIATHFGIGEICFRKLCKDYHFVLTAIEDIRHKSSSRVCKKCKEEKNITEFQKDVSKKGGYKWECKTCWKGYQQNNYADKKDIIDANNKYWYENNKEARCIKIEQYRRANKVRFYQIKKERLASDLLFRLKIKLRDRICVAFKSSGWDKRNSTALIIGCDYNTAKDFIEKKFKPGMTWSNHGEWHIDHIIPLASAKTENELIELCHYSNLQPLWAVENLAKGARVFV